MATDAKINENISQDAMSAYLDRWMGLEEDANKLMMAAMEKCRTGPRAEQKELKDEMKDAGVRIKAFMTLVEIRKAELKIKKKANKLEDQDLDQYRKIAEEFEPETIFGFMARKALGEASFED